MKAAVTGASGHIGNCLVRYLIEKGVEVKALVHDFENDLGNLNIELVRGNLLDEESLKILCSGADVVFHLAATIALDNRHREKVLSVNIQGTKNLVDTAISSGVKKFIHFSSIDAFQYNSNMEILDENVPLTESRKSVYAFSKAEGERIIMNASKNGMEVVVLCPTAVIGPFDYRESFLGQALIKIYRNKIPMLISGGFNWVDVRDVALAAFKAYESGKPGEKYILSGNFCTLKELSALTGKISGKPTPKFIAPVFLAQLSSPFYEFYYSLTNQKPMYTSQSLDLLIRAPRNISFEKAKNELDYNPRPLEQTLRDTFAWYKQHNYLN